MPTKWNILLSAKNDRFHNGDKSFSVLLRLRKMVFVEKITDASLWFVIVSHEVLPSCHCVLMVNFGEKSVTVVFSFFYCREYFSSKQVKFSGSVVPRGGNFPNK